jgi:DNA replication ATP-dependent helicase Dna2
VLISRDAAQPRWSVFGALIDRGFDTMLTATYRMNAALTAWPSTQFYAGRLTPANATVAARRLTLTTPPAQLADVLDPQEPLVFLDVPLRNTTTRSQREASAVTDLVLALLASGVPAGEIGVIAPYRAQGREIRNLLRRAVSPEALAALVVDTVERMQGQEREVIILSLTTSHPVFAASIADFLFQPQRLNVAITRPRSKLIIVGSRHLRTLALDRLEAQLGLERLNDLLRCCALRTLPHGG